MLLPCGPGGIPGRGGILGRGGIGAEVGLQVSPVQVNLFRCISNVSMDTLLCHIGNEGIHPCDFDEA